MKAICMLIGVAFAAGCQKQVHRKAPLSAGRHHARAETVQTTTPTVTNAAQPAGPLLSYDPPAEVTGDSWMQREADKAEVVKRLRAYAAQADPDDPLALSEKRLEELLKSDDLVLY